MCLLVSASDCELTQVFAVSSLLAAITIGSWSVIRPVPTHLCLSAAASFLLAFIVWIFHAAELDAGELLFSPKLSRLLVVLGFTDVSGSADIQTHAHILQFSI